jgi:hypothetical protein
MTTDLHVPASARSPIRVVQHLLVRFGFSRRENLVFAKQSHFTPAASRIASQRPIRQQYATGTLRWRPRRLMPWAASKHYPATPAGDPPLSPMVAI